MSAQMNELVKANQQQQQQNSQLMAMMVNTQTITIETQAKLMKKMEVETAELKNVIQQLQNTISQLQTENIALKKPHRIEPIPELTVSDNIVEETV